MFEALLRRLLDPGPEQLPEPDARLALAALLVRLARADGDYTDVEQKRIDQLLAERHELDAKQADALRRKAEVLEAEAPDTVRFTRAIKQHVALENREGIMEALWSVALADGTREHEEDGFLRLVANLLGVADRDSALARQRVEERQRE